MTNKKDWATKCLKTTFRPDFEKLVEEIQHDASNWNEDDHRMWKMQCQVGDTAFQHLFCISKGKPMPDWATNRLPKLYSVLEENETLKEENLKLKKTLDKLIDPNHND